MESVEAHRKPGRARRWRLVLEPDLAQLRPARLLVAEALEGYLPEDAVEVARLLVTELVANATVHAATPVEVRVVVRRAVVRVEVRDRSPELPRLCEIGEDATAGRGLVLVDRMAAAWGAERARRGKGKVVWFELARPERARAVV
jgi:anti-sigma regulatory factor (Ser/Thr protein kinase)